MEIRCDSAEELRTHILILLSKLEARCRVRTAFCRSISERRALTAAADAYEDARKSVEATVIAPRMKPFYPCAVCGTEPVSREEVLAGFDTCEACVPRSGGR